MLKQSKEHETASFGLIASAGGIADEISTITDIGQRMSLVGVTADSRQVSFDFRV
jgi:hypothetical protein